ncbi:hypothetical protein [Candidatus Aalborgicola defluviihabitans]|uniref:hypothetical protein n=1 Tax=Candidatus Aalborgicola defluviihabitans TaxID=3386187 RepID=UPI0039B8D0C9
MSTVGQIEKQTQARIVALLQGRLHYTYLGNWIDRAGNANIEPERLTAWLTSQGVPAALASRALFELQKVAGDTSQTLYDRNREVYRLLRYGIKLKPRWVKTPSRSGWWTGSIRMPTTLPLPKR